MNDADFTYGCRSAIQKGIRRGDLDLVHTCFEELWAEKSQRNWLMWRATTLVMEEAWQMIGEYGELLASGSKEENDWRKFLYRLCFATKSKDAMGLMFLVNREHKALTEMAHPEMEEMVLWYNLAMTWYCNLGSYRITKRVGYTPCCGGQRWAACWLIDNFVWQG
jgi:hypothetical protein